MSAIAGIINLYADGDIISSMHNSMFRRGPDGKACFCVNGATLLHTCLSCGKTEMESQPLVLKWGRESYAITFDGKLFNPQELVRELRMLGHSIQGSSDAELMLHAYIQWQSECLEKCNGVFSFAVLEITTGRVFLARDRIGVKPLFYLEHQGGLLFASEMKTILTYPGVGARLDENGAAEILLLGPGRTPGSGILRNMKELEPGCYATFDAGKLCIRRFWKLTDREHLDSFDDTAEQVRFLMKDAVHRQISGEGSVGAFISGGLDSGIVSALCAQELEGMGSKLKTFSLDYEDNDRYFTPGKFQPNADPEYIRIMQEYLQTEQHWTVLTPEDLAEGIADATIARDLPGMADVDSSLLAFCARVRNHAQVVFSGECADEIFGGYPWYRDPEIRNAEGFPWAQTLQERAFLLHPWLKEKIDPRSFVIDRYAQTISQCDILPSVTGTERRMKEMMNLNFRWFMQTLLDRNDRMSMYNGLEVRVPFCDYRIAEYLYGVPWEMKEYGGMEKGLLRYAFRDLIPARIRLRKKSPFPKTHDPKYLNIASQLLETILHDPNAPIYQLVRRDALEHLLTQDFTWPWYGQLMRRPQTMMYMVQINYWMEHYSVAIE